MPEKFHKFYPSNDFMRLHVVNKPPIKKKVSTAK